MQEYRRKGRVVEVELIHPEPFYRVYDHPSRDYWHDVDQADFEREFERVEEVKLRVNPYDVGRRCENIHCEICTYCMTRESANCVIVGGVTRYYCHVCWPKRVEEEEYFDHKDGRYKDLSKKPRPLFCQYCGHVFGAQASVCCNCFRAPKAAPSIPGGVDSEEKP